MYPMKFEFYNNICPRENMYLTVKVNRGEDTVNDIQKYIYERAVRTKTRLSKA